MKSEEFSVKTEEGILFLREYKKGLEIVRYEGEDIYLTVPGKIGWAEKARQNPDSNYIEERKIISIGKKAMLSCKNLRRVRLPAEMEEVDDWAFAYCDELREICLPKKEIRFGRGIFRECGKLRAVTVEGNHKDIGGLLAAAVTLLDAPYLFSPVRSGDREWLRQWDSRMLQILRMPDQEGYSKMVLCGEEDYGSKENNLEYFLNQKRRGKVRIAFMRLLNPVELEEETKKELETYLREHTAGSGGEKKAGENKKGAEEILDETWQVLHEEHGEDESFYKLFTEIGCLTEHNFDKVLAETGEDCPEMKAWFLKYKENKIGYQDFFGELMLD